MKLRIVIIAALGLALAFYLVMYVGLGAVFSAAAAVGWSGFAILCLYVLVPFLILGAAWYILLPGSPLPELRIFVWARTVRDSATDVLPFSQLGGIVIGSYALIGAGSVVTKSVPDYALIMGNPGRQKGWMSRHGHALQAGADGIMQCPESGLRYREVEPGVVRCLDLGEDDPLAAELTVGKIPYRDWKVK